MSSSAGPGQAPTLLLPADPQLRTVVTTLVVHAARVPADLAAEDVIYAGRTFAGRVDAGWGNPVTLAGDTDAERAHALLAHFAWLQGPTRRAQDLRGRIRAGDLTGKTLTCWCAPKLCHAMTLAGLGNGLVEATKAWLVDLQEATEGSHR